MNMLIRILMLAGLLLTGQACAETIRLAPPQSDFDSRYDYFYQLLSLALTKSRQGTEQDTLVFSASMEQGRALQELNEGELIDVYWAGISKTRGRQLLAIPVPLLQGLLGYRIPIIRTPMSSPLASINTLEQLQQASVCQGDHWPDADILAASGLQVVRSPVYEQLFRMVDAGRCDLFLRALHEGAAELRARRLRYPQLQLHPNLMIHYPYAMVFYVSRTRPELAARLRAGLETAIDDGSFARHLREHPATAHLFPLSQWQQHRIINLPNPDLPDHFELDNQRYWLKFPASGQ